jgi:hypothetical protein
MRASLLVVVILGVGPTVSYACSCAGTGSIGNALTLADAVVVGKVRGHREPDYSSDHQLPALIDVEVTDSLKGGVMGNIEIAKTMMCYQSFPEDDLEVGKFYIFPLQEIDLSNPEQAWGLMIGSDSPVPSHKMFRLPVCSHNALFVDGHSLYTSEWAPGGGRQLDYYLPLILVQLLLPIGLLSIWGLLVAAAVAITATVVFVRRRRRKVTHAV